MWETTSYSGFLVNYAMNQSLWWPTLEMNCVFSTRMTDLTLQLSDSKHYSCENNLYSWAVEWLWAIFLYSIKWLITHNSRPASCLQLVNPVEEPDVSPGSWWRPKPEREHRTEDRKHNSKSVSMLFYIFYTVCVHIIRMYIYCTCTSGLIGFNQQLRGFLCLH